MSSEEKDSVWKLLDQKKEIEIDPFFARNVVREVKRIEEKKYSPLSPSSVKTWSTVLAILVLVFTLYLIQSRQQSPQKSFTDREVSPPLQVETLSQELGIYDHYVSLTTKSADTLADEEVVELVNLLAF